MLSHRAMQDSNEMTEKQRPAYLKASPDLRKQMQRERKSPKKAPATTGHTADYVHTLVCASE